MYCFRGREGHHNKKRELQRTMRTTINMVKCEWPLNLTSNIYLFVITKADLFFCLFFCVEWLPQWHEFNVTICDLFSIFFFSFLFIWHFGEKTTIYNSNEFWLRQGFLRTAISFVVLQNAWDFFLFTFLLFMADVMYSFPRLHRWNRWFDNKKKKAESMSLIFHKISTLEEWIHFQFPMLYLSSITLSLLIEYLKTNTSRTFRFE